MCIRVYMRVYRVESNILKFDDIGGYSRSLRMIIVFFFLNKNGDINNKNYNVFKRSDNRTSFHIFRDRDRSR